MSETASASRPVRRSLGFGRNLASDSDPAWVSSDVSLYGGFIVKGDVVRGGNFHELDLLGTGIGTGNMVRLGG